MVPMPFSGLPIFGPEGWFRRPLRGASGGSWGAVLGRFMSGDFAVPSGDFSVLSGDFAVLPGEWQVMSGGPVFCAAFAVTGRERAGTGG